MLLAIEGQRIPTTEDQVTALNRKTRREPSEATSRRPNLSHTLASFIGGRLYFFTGLGLHDTAEAAQARWESAPRNGIGVIVRQWDAVDRLGRVYGTHQELLSLLDLEVLP